MYKASTASPSIPSETLTDFPTTETKNSGTQSVANSGNALNTFLNNLPDVVCFSHLRWDFVYQRPQHLLSRFAKYSRVFYFEEPVFYDNAQPHFDVTTRGENITVLVAHLPHGLTPQESDEKQIELLDAFLVAQKINRYLLWYYTPMALEISRQLQPELTVFDCMDELSAFKFAPPRLRELEAEMFWKADVVFTGGQSLFEAKKASHANVHAFPSSIDKAHFGTARKGLDDPADQAYIPYPRLGFFGVLDERFDIELLENLANAQPDWQFIMIGPVVKIDPETLPKNANIYYLGGKKYEELPSYLAGWDVALLPFADNESTRFISPTKTPEYLAAGKPVVSTPIRDVVRPYGENNLVHIARDAAEFEVAIQNALLQNNDPEWLQKVDAFLANTSWEQTWQNMALQMQKALAGKTK
ncbi:glycosyltransferase family 1 protein [Adhaeribacter sp. BT258]|uniref:Glycosyltransferase family 1 protein n=1 Tax=Adhaeribacter terrigena TaxID=2793070 RepID=A0ABS1BWM3_9BACT|nr:glycosyltransferase family 1 protein [Adhaeribacter terrigena]MBK0401445.1 glycosyltransferase family 1 protein [Adhaeribacter terrigena]